MKYVQVMELALQWAPQRRNNLAGHRNYNHLFQRTEKVLAKWEGEPSSPRREVKYVLSVGKYSHGTTLNRLSFNAFREQCSKDRHASLYWGLAR
jgi:hypothetical protein